MRSIFPRLRVWHWLTIVAAIAALLATPNALVSLLRSMQDTTHFAPGYDEEKFRSIEAGMGKEDVIRLLGQPLKNGTATPWHAWFYGAKTMHVDEDGGMSWDGGAVVSPGTSYTIVESDASGRVTQVSGNYLAPVPVGLIGAPLSEVRRVYGEPRAIRNQPSSRVFSYTDTEVDGSYHRREVGFDERGRVNQTIARWYQD